MMTIDIRKLNAKKEYFGSMEFSYKAPEELIEIPFASFDGEVKVSFDYELYEDNSIEIKGKVAYRLVGQCSRCLKNACMQVEGELDAYFEPRKDAEDYSYFGGIVDLSKAVDDAIMSSMPFILSCEQECTALEYSDNQ
jgi:uncharacterized metal-binding protein YceD (DUF177 family)